MWRYKIGIFDILTKNIVCIDLLNYANKILKDI